MSPAAIVNGHTNGTNGVNGVNGVNGHSQKFDFKTFHNVINNELATTSKTRHTLDPASKERHPEVPVSTQEDVDKAVAAARAASKPWSNLSFEERGQMLRDYADAIDSYKDGFADMLTREQGKPLAQSHIEIGMSTDWLRAFSKMEIPEEVVEDTQDRKIYVRHVPLGVACGIVPWNFPILLAIGKVGPSLYTGNPIIIKPSPFAPYCNLKLAELGMRFFPPGVYQALSGEEDLGPMFTAHPDVDKISFTGSIPTGKKVMAASSPTLKRVTLELGGNDPAIICEDVDIDAIIPKLGISSFLCSSQICMMVKRLYVHETIYPQFLSAFAAHIQSTMKVGSGLDPDNFIGPLQNSMQYAKVKDMYAQIEKQGWKAALGGSMPDPSNDDGSKGFFFQPTLIEDPPEDSRIVTEEPFGPILPVLRWREEEDVLARANDSKMGLGASVWSADLDRAERMAKRLEAGSVWVNSHFDVAPHAPFGGFKWSGVGQEWGVNGLKSYCNAQTVWVKKSLW
ncbi:MAG: hypothetical protein Q9219_004786 [cf. Caloplaca sp. 3 TL-2023]